MFRVYVATKQQTEEVRRMYINISDILLNYDFMTLFKIFNELINGLNMGRPDLIDPFNKWVKQVFFGFKYST